MWRWTSLAQLVPHLERIEVVHLTTRGLGAPLVLSLLWTLRSISIHYRDYRTIKAEELFAAAEGCPGLTDLDLSSLRAFTSICLITDEDIAEFTSMVPQLTSFIFRVDNLLGIKQWHAIGRACRALRKLAISDREFPVPLLELANEKGCLFPELQKMQFNYLYVNFETTPEGFIALLRHMIHNWGCATCWVLVTWNAHLWRSAERHGLVNVWSRWHACCLHSWPKMENVWNVLPCLLLWSMKNAICHHAISNIVSLFFRAAYLTFHKLIISRYLCRCFTKHGFFKARALRYIRFLCHYHRSNSWVHERQFQWHSSWRSFPSDLVRQWISRASTPTPQHEINMIY